MYMKLSKSDIQHLNACRSIFLEADTEETGIITKRKFLLLAKQGHYKFNELFLVNFLRDIQLTKDETSSEAQLSYNRLMKLIDVYSMCPIRNKLDLNESEKFTQVMIYQTLMNDEEIDRTYELI